MSDVVPGKAIDIPLLEDRAFDPRPGFRRQAGAKDPGVCARATAVSAGRLGRHVGFPRTTRRNSEEAA